MSRLSLHRRLAFYGAAAILLALAAAAMGLTWLFGTHVERRAIAEMEVQLEQVLSGLTIAGGRLTADKLPMDPRYSRPYGGRYWQVQKGGETLRSRSLWDETLSIDGESAPSGDVRIYRQRGPGGTPVLGIERTVRLPATLRGGEAKLTVAMDASELTEARKAFALDLAPSLVLLAALLIGAQLAQQVYGLRPLKQIGRRVSDLRTGRASRMGADWPDEMRPLTNEIDALIEERAADIERARFRAGDLAHGLKTPLQALLGEANRLSEKGDEAAASAIESVADSMLTHVNRELARTRMAARQSGTQARANLAEVAGRVVAVVKRTPDGARLEWTVEAADDLVAVIDPADLAEAIGALAENAARYAEKAVRISARRVKSKLTIRVCDDGPGIPDEDLMRVLERGRRLDEGSVGEGLGLAIATDIAEAARGRLTLEPGKEGLCAVLELTAAGT